MQSLHHDDPAYIGEGAHRYKLIARLGHGGMGVVYYARRFDGTLVALKVITPVHANRDNYRKYFEHEIKLALKVDSPYVAKVLDYDIEGDVWWFASEYVPGLTVAEAIQRYGNTLPAETVRKLIYDLALALQAVHAEGIVHRDVKPQNVMLGPTGIKLIDFGIAHSADGTQVTTADGIIGTPAYMCPEQLTGKRPTTPWDIFALGGLIVYACSGHAPFVYPDEDQGAHQMLFDIMDDNKPPNLSGVDPEFHDIIQRCLSKQPGDRPVANQLHQYLQVMPESQAPQTLFLTDVLKTAIRVEQKQSDRTALHVEALKPIMRRRKAGENNQQWQARNRTYEREMEHWRKAERKRRKAARKAKRRVSLDVKFVIAAAIACLLYQFGPSHLLPWWNELKKHIPTATAEAAPGEKLPGGKSFVTLPGAPFTAGKPGQTYDPDNKGSSVKVTKIETAGYQFNLQVAVSGFVGHGDMPFSDSCVVVRSGKSSVTVYPTKYEAGGELHGARVGSIVFSAVFHGSYVFYAECNQDKSVSGTSLGEVSNVNEGTLQYRNTVVPIMGSRMNGHNLVVSVIPDDHGASQYCMRSSSSTARPSKIEQTRIGDIVFTELTFKGINKGILYPTCSEKNHVVAVHGDGVHIG